MSIMSNIYGPSPTKTRWLYEMCLWETGLILNDFGASIEFRTFMQATDKGLKVIKVR